MVVLALEDLEKIVNEKRKKVIISLSPTILRRVDEVIKEYQIVDEDGQPYARSWLIEDMIIWILRKKRRLEQFIDETYEEVEEEDGKEEVES